ncbi:DUF6056 family protein [Estrella lausannensis]|uniref:Putative membrane protein n=1 Tax=Estrella lausannensis TaxID=483423 RepID=A0A0H5DRF9_9BACT|nr:DUF6056 family protein [Estrella lausannensis]CRX38778.1 putative membrane protein [Estrella lausannensis]
MDGNKKIWIILGSLALMASALFILMTALWQPMAADDYDILTSYLDTHSLFHHVMSWYNNWSGRVLGYAIGGLALSGDMPRAVFQSISAFMFISLACLCLLLTQKEKIECKRADLFLYLIMLSLLWFCLPIIGQTVFWTSGAVVYLWPAFFLLLLIYSILRPFITGARDEDPHFVAAISAFFLGLIVGNFQEQAALSLLTFLLIVSVIPSIRHKIAFFGKVLPAAAGLFIGFLILSMAPGNAERQSLVEGLSFSDTIFRVSRFISKIFSADTLVFVFALAILKTALRSFDNDKAEGARESTLIWIGLSAVSALPILIFPKFEQPRTAFYSSLFMILFLAASLMGRKKALEALLERQPYLVLLAALPLFMSTSHAALMAKKLHSQDLERTELAREALKTGKEVAFAPRPAINTYKVFAWDLSTNPKSMYNKMYSKVNTVPPVKVDMALVEDPDYP